jgi:hypothetical protein
VTDVTGLYLVQEVPPGPVQVVVQAPAPYVAVAASKPAVVATHALTTVDFVLSNVAISPTAVTVTSGNQQSFTASGGVHPYSWSISPNGSGGTIDGAGFYTAGFTPGAADTVVLTDSLGASVTAAVTVLGTLSIAPSSATVDPGFQRAFTASGGVPPYAWSLSANGSGGSITPGGIYTAGPTGSVSDTITVTDSLGSTRTALVTVPARLTIANGGGGTTTVPAGGQVTLTASGGSGPYTWTMTTNGSGGTVTSGGAYTAGPNAGTDTITVTDANGGSTTITITVPVTPPADSEARGAPALGAGHVGLAGAMLALLGLALAGPRGRARRR